MKITFPPQPVPDKTIFEASEDIFYQYNARENSWIKIDGQKDTIDPASPLRNGLMTSDDLKKLLGLLVPPPKTSLTSPSCSFTFDQGIFGFRSSKEHLFIEHELNLRDKDEEGFTVDRKEVWKIHENTYGINFRVNIPKLVDELEQRGQLTFRRTMGPIGPKGDAGTDGINKLDTGPKGLKGLDGANASFDGFLAQDNIGFLVGDGNRGIIDIRMEEVSPDENFLIVTRANVGNPELCPSFVSPIDLDSKWLVVVDERPPQRIIIDECDPTLCGVSICRSDAKRAVIQTFCATRLYFLDFEEIEGLLRERFETLIQQLKETKESVTLELMKAMIDLFTEQKLALCCAIENCESRRENQRHRNIIDTARIQAAQAGFSIIVDGEDTRNYQDTDPDKDCPPSEEDLVSLDNEQPILPSDASVLDIPEYVTFRPTSGAGVILLGEQMQEPVASNSIELPAGEYTAFFEQLSPSPDSGILPSCCFFTGIGTTQSIYEDLRANPSKVGPGFDQIFKRQTPYNRRFKFRYQTDEGEAVYEHPDTSNYADCTKCAASSSKIYPFFTFVHVGGLISFEYTGGTFEREKFAGVTITVDGITAPFRGGFSDGGAVSLRLARKPDPVPVTNPTRPGCDPFDGGIAITASLNSLRVARGVVTDAPQTFIPVGITGDTDVSLAIFEMPTPGTYDIEILESSEPIYRAQIINGQTIIPGLSDPNGDWFSVTGPNDEMRILFQSSGQQIINKDARYVIKQIDQPDVHFAGGFLVTRVMYEAARDDNVQDFLHALNLSKSQLESDDYYIGLDNLVYDVLPNFSVDNLMEDIRNKLRPFNSGHLAVVFDGYQTEQSETANTLVQSFERSDGFISPEDDKAFYVGKKIRIVTDDPAELKLFYDTVDFIDPLGRLHKPLPFEFPKVSPNEGIVNLGITCVESEYTGCEEPLISARLDCRLRRREIDALIIELDPGDYVLTISDCCCQASSGYQARVGMKHVGVNGEEILTTPDLGGFGSQIDASLHYVGNSFSFTHVSGDVRLWILDAVPQNVDGSIVGVEIQRAECFDVGKVVGTAVTGDDEDAFGNFIPCDMPLEHINFYESGWKSRACCGALVEVGGINWIVVKRSLGTDMTCGGGESEVTDCIRNGLDIGIYPAIAFPTIDGISFFGKPTGGYQRFFRDEDLESIVLAKIKAGAAIATVNNPEESLDAIIFPFEMS